MTETGSQENQEVLPEEKKEETKEDGALDQKLDILQNLLPTESEKSRNESEESPVQESTKAGSQLNSPKKDNFSSTSTSRSGSSRQAKPSQTAKNSKQQSEESCGCSESELDDYIDAIVNKHAPPPRELRNPILQLLNRRRVQALVKGDYDVAEEQDNTIQILNRVVQKEDNKSNEDAQFEILFGRYQQLQRDYQDITDKWNGKIDKYNEDEEQLYNELLQKQNEEKETFHSKWADPDFLRPFTKPSPKLNSMREQERAMAVARMYQQAKTMKLEADRLQKEETDAAQQRILQTKEIEWNRMLERHENDRKKFIDHKNKNVAFLESEKQKELKPTVNAINQIKSKKGLLLSTKQSSATITKSAQDIEAQTPRTHRQYANFKSEKKKPKLNVQPVTEQEFQSQKKPAKSKLRLSKTQSQKASGRTQQDESEAQNSQRNQESSKDESAKENSNEIQNSNETPNANENQNGNVNQSQNQNENENQEENASQNQNENQEENASKEQNENENQEENASKEQNENQNQEENSSKEQNENENQNQDENASKDQNENQNQNQDENASKDQNQNENQDENANQSPDKSDAPAENNEEQKDANGEVLDKNPDASNEKESAREEQKEGKVDGSEQAEEEKKEPENAELPK